MSKIKDSKKRENYICWDDYFMSICILSSKRSKDPNKQVGACLVNMKNQIVGVGYNGFPRGCSDDLFPWSKGDLLEENKYGYVIHAELNAILNTTIHDLDDCRLFTSKFPCNRCAQVIIQKGIREVIYLEDSDKEIYRISKKMFNMVGITYKKFIPQTNQITIDLGFPPLKLSE